MKKHIFNFLILVAANCPLGAWGFTPPVGIPAPSFPADLDVSRPTLPSPWTSEVAGWYFVQRNQAGCSDSRTYGTPTEARCTLPSSPAAGSKVVLHGLYATQPNINWTGTSANPIWLMAYDNANKPNISQEYGYTGSYIIADGISSSMNMQGGVNVVGHHIMLRNFSVSNTWTGQNYSGIGMDAGNNNVIYKATVGPLGNWQYTGTSDIDDHGATVSGNATYIWFLNSTFFHCQGDGIQIENGQGNAAGAHHIYIGRNTAYENYQSGMWVKNATDVIFSENDFYGIHVTPNSATGDGQATGGQYDAKYVWWIANRIHDSNVGIKMSGGSDNSGGPWYAIGNLIYNIISNNGCNAWGMGGLSYRNNGGFYGYYNTLYNVDSFISVVPSNSGEFRNNIFAHQYTTTGCPALNEDGRGTYSLDYNLWDTANPTLKYNGVTYSTLAAFSSATGRETHRVVGNPLFVNAPGDLSLQAGSPAIDAANPTEEAVFATFQSRYGIDIRKDFVGTVRPYGPRWDIGAYEFTAGTVSRKPNPPSNIQVR